MAASRVGKTKLASLLLLFLISERVLAQIQLDGLSSPSSNLPWNAISNLLVQLSALNSFNENSTMRHAYKNGELVAAQKLMESPYIIYKLTLNLEPECKDKETCSREVCTLDVRQHERGVIDVVYNSIHCVLLQTQYKQQSEQEQIMIENIEKQIIGQSISLDHEVQTSANHNDRPFIAVRALQSEYCPGCPYELNPSLPGLSAFGNQVLQSMDETSISDLKQKLISIIRVTRAVPPGLNVIQYQLLMEIGESNCLKTSLLEISECPLQSNLPIKLCLVTFEERPWQIGSRRIIKNNCTDFLNTDNEVSASVDPNVQLFKSVTANKDDDVSTKTEFFDQIAQEAQEIFRVPYIDSSTNDSTKITTVTEIVKEFTQEKAIVEENKTNKPISKFSDKMKEFDVFLDDFDTPIKIETTSAKNLGIPVIEKILTKERIEEKNFDNKNIESQNSKSSDFIMNIKKETEKLESSEFNPTVESIRSKRSLVKDLESKSMLRKLAVKAVELLDDLYSDNKRKYVLDIIDSLKERQEHLIVYYMTVEVVSTDCSEKDKTTECLDEVRPGANEICRFDISVNEKKPLQTVKLLHYKCKSKKNSESRGKRQLVGAPTTRSPNDPEVQKYVQLGLRKYSETLEGSYEPIVTNVKDVSVQVVSGLLYKIKTDIGISTCKKGEKENCKLKSNEGIKECIIEAWSQPWIDHGNPKITVKCDESKRQKRSLRGQHYNEKMLQLSKMLKEEKLFHEFIEQFNRNYHTQEEKERRFKIFKENLDMIEELQRNEQGTGRYGVTQFTDLTKAEFKAKYLGLKPQLKSENDIPMPMAEIPDIKLPIEFDWRHHNVVTDVKDQGQCGSCWAFSVTGNVEGQYAIKHGKLLSLSEQELVDCDKFDDGCNGGLPDTAYRAIEELGGLELENDYPYDGEDEKCHFNKNKVKVTVVSGLNITSNETQMAQWLVKNGPMSIGINANAMQFYMGGVSHPFNFLCSPDSLDHGVLIVGYGIKTYPIFKKKMPYWLIKNSWGPWWGEQGYYRIYRGDGTCGVNKMVTSAVIA